MRELEHSFACELGAVPGRAGHGMAWHVGGWAAWRDGAYSGIAGAVTMAHGAAGRGRSLDGESRRVGNSMRRAAGGLWEGSVGACQGCVVSYGRGQHAADRRCALQCCAVLWLARAKDD
jgi:hypothetical protein